MIGRDALLRLRRRSPTGVWMMTVAFATLVIVASIPVRVGEYHNGLQEVGYLSAINWSLGFTVFTPLFLLFVLRALRSVDRMINRLAGNGMIVDEHYQPVPDAADAVRRVWEEQLRRLGPVALAAVGVAFLVVFLDWLGESGGPLLFDTQPPAHEIDWSVAHMGSPVPGDAELNAVFSFVAYLQQVVFGVGVLLTGIVAYAITELLRSLVPTGPGLRLIPSPSSRDRRRGFQVFTALPENLLLAVAFAYGHLYLGRVWNVYQRSDAGSFQEFVLADLAIGFGSGGDGVLGFLSGLFEPQVFGVVGVLILIITAVLGVVALMTVLFTLRVIARDARETFMDHLDHLGGDSYQGVPVAEVRQRMETMTLWPVRYPRPNQLLWLALLAGTVMFFYRLGFFYLGALLLYVIKRARGFEKEFAAEPAAAEAPRAEPVPR